MVEEHVDVLLDQRLLLLDGSIGECVCNDTALTSMIVLVGREKRLVRFVSVLIKVVPVRELGFPTTSKSENLRPKVSVQGKLVWSSTNNVAVLFMELQHVSVENTSELIVDGQRQSRDSIELRSGDSAKRVEIEAIQCKTQPECEALKDRLESSHVLEVEIPTTSSRSSTAAIGC